MNGNIDCWVDIYCPSLGHACCNLHHTRINRTSRTSSLCFGVNGYLQAAGALAGALALDWRLVRRDRFAQAVPATPFARPHWRPPSQCPSSSERLSYIDLCLINWSLSQSVGNGKKAKQQWVHVEHSVESHSPGNFYHPTCVTETCIQHNLHSCASSFSNS